MKKGIHPAYRKVLFLDTSSGDEWPAYCTLASNETKEIEGEELPVVKLEISAHSHPFWTGQARQVDTEGRIDRFRRRYAGKVKGGDAPAAEAPQAGVAEESA